MLFPNGPFLSLQGAGEPQCQQLHHTHEFVRKHLSIILHSSGISDRMVTSMKSKQSVSGFTIGFTKSLEQAYKSKILVQKPQKRRKTSLVLGCLFLEGIYGTEASGES